MICSVNNVWVVAQERGKKRVQRNNKKSSGKSKLRDEALKWCDKWIEKSLRCKPPNSKIEKFQHRFQKVVDDAVWHAEGAKRCPTRRPVKPVKYRRRRDGEGKLNDELNDDFFTPATDEDGDFEERYNSALSVQELGAKCTLRLTDFFEHEDLQTCRKLGSWTRRANGLVGQVTTIMFLCLQSESISTSDVYKQLTAEHPSERESPVSGPGYSPYAV